MSELIGFMIEKKRKDPIIVIDEIDKLGNRADFFLEILNPGLKKILHEKYFDLDFDLTKVWFITTANYLEKLSDPILTRLKKIELKGFTNEQKEEIITKNIFPEIVNNFKKENNKYEKTDFEIDKNLV